MHDSFSLFNGIRKEDSSLYMAFFDIQSLYTNIPLDQTIDICVNRVFQHIKKVKGMLKKYVTQLLALTVESSCFLLNNVYYKRIHGVTMGSPLGPTFGNLFLVDYENIWLEKCPHQFKSKYYRRHVDDIFLMFKKKDHVKKFFKYMNSCHQNIKFTFEDEHNNKIAFLSISITRVGNELKTSLF